MKKTFLCAGAILLLFLANTHLLATEKFVLPQYEKFVLKNGLTVYLMEQHEVPLIYISAVIPAGAVKDGMQSGLATLTAEGLLFGTQNYTKTQIEETLDFLGATYGASAGLESATVGMSFVNTDLEKVLPIFKEIVMHPTFDPTEFEKRQQRMLTELELAKERPSQVIGAYFNRFLFNDHIYGNPVDGTQSAVEKITADDLKKFYQANYTPRGAAVAIVGNFKTSVMKKQITRHFQAWPAQGSPSATKFTTAPEFSQNRVLLVNKADATETRFLIGGPGVKRSNPDYIPIQVVNTILGGRFTSWLNDELRVNRGLTYGARSFFSTYRNAGTFAMYSYTRTPKTIEALDVTLEVLNRLHHLGIDAETLRSAQNYVKGQFPPNYETSGDLAKLLTDMFFYDFNEAFINDFQTKVDELTPEKVNTIIQKYFPQNNLQFVLIGKANEIRDAVKKYGELTEKEITTDGF
jgi:predicted Zn-dependent peptidase